MTPLDSTTYKVTYWDNYSMQPDVTHIKASNKQEVYAKLNEHSVEVIHIEETDQ